MNTKVIYFLASLMASLLFNIPLIRAGKLHGKHDDYSNNDLNVDGHGTNVQVDNVQDDLNIGGSDNTIDVGKLHGKHYDDYSSNDLNVDGHGTNVQVDNVQDDLNIGGSDNTVDVGKLHGKHYDDYYDDLNV